MSARRARQFLILAVLPMFASDVLAQARVAGVVRDSSGAIIQGAEITVEGTTRRAVTDRRGDFQLTGLRAGSVVVSVRRIGYGPQSLTVVVYDGDNRLDFTLGVAPQQLDTIATREIQLLRERPLLREMEENRKIGLGQFVTREMLARQQGGFLVAVVSQMRGLQVVRSKIAASQLWLGTKYMPTSDCVEMEDHLGSPETLIPIGANCGMCYPDVYLDYTKITARGQATNLGQFAPDQLEAMEVYLGPAETPARYSAPGSGCGVIVLHTRAVESKPRRIASAQDEPTRSRVHVSASVAAGKPGPGCPDCGAGSATDAAVGYTFRDRWVIGARYARWSGSAGGPQSITVRHALVEWYPRPEPGRFKWFVNAGLGNMSVDLKTTHYPSHRDEFVGSGLPAAFLGTGSDIALVRRLVLTPFFSYGRTIGGRSVNTRCNTQIHANGDVFEFCGIMPSIPRTFALTQVGTRIGWR